MRLGIGYSTALSEEDAAKEAVAGALPGVIDAAVAVVFSTEHYEPQRLAKALAAELPGIPIVGCCSAGVIAGEKLLTRGVGVGVLCGHDVQVGLGVGGPLSRNSRDAGREAAAHALEGLPLLSPERHRALIVLPDAFAGNPTEVVRGALEEAGSGVAWAGGGAGDNFGIGRTAQFAGDRAYVDHVVVLALDAPWALGAGVCHGWKPFGPATIVTRSEGTRLLELDDQPAFEVYRRTAEDLGARVSLERFTDFAMMHPLGIPQPWGGHLIRDPLHAEPSGAMQCVAEIPTGTLVRLMSGDRASLLEAARSAARDAKDPNEEPPRGALMFDCFSRFLAFGGELQEELRVVSETLGPDTPLLGCLTLGEVATEHGVPQFHNKTAVVLGV